MERQQSLTKFALLVMLAVAAAVPGLLLKFNPVSIHPLLEALAFGAAILGAGFLLSWSAEAAERRLTQALIVAILALITVLPEYAVDIYYAFQAGRMPQSEYPQFAAANMTGANRLLVGVAWPLMVFTHWWRTRETQIELRAGNAGEIFFLGAASLYAFVVLLRDRLDVLDTVVLLSMFGLYLWQASRQPHGAGEEDDEEEDEEASPAAALFALSPSKQVIVMSVMAMSAAAIVLLMAEPFAESLVAAGTALGLDKFLLIQWLAPLASEAPTVTVALLLVLAARARVGLATMLSDKINQWTLLVAMLPLALSVGARHFAPLEFDARQHEEFFLTAAQSLFALSLLLGLRLRLWGAAALLALFALQVGLAFFYRDDERQVIEHLTQIAWVYLVLAALIGLFHRARVARIVRLAWSRADARGAVVKRWWA